jgi:cytochrome c-type biogenesis protein CcmF
MADIGTLSLYLVLLIATWAGALALVGTRRRACSMIHAARMALNAVAALASVALLVLAYAFAVGDFSLTYVYRYSELSMPMFYRLTSVWGGQEGSLLFWLWLLTVVSAWAVQINHQTLKELLPYLLIVLVVVIDFFCLLLLLSSNPFETFLIETPLAGRGLNPLLQNPYMVTHPPALYIGYVGMVIPFALAVASLLAGQSNDLWIRAARPWAMGSWYFLSLGLVLGMLWAYEELGWGGYWAWDPVENAGLIPWFTSTAFLHSTMVQERRGMLKIWNLLLAVMTFELTLFGTFITRSGLIESVHAFSRSPVGWYLLGFIALVAAGVAALMIWRRDLLRGSRPLESTLSREFSFTFNNWMLLGAAFLVFTLTLLPSISNVIGEKITINASAFNRWMTPLGLLLLLLKGIGPMLAWRGSSPKMLRRQFTVPALLAVATGLTLGGFGLTHRWALITFCLSAFVVGTVFQETLRGIFFRRRNHGHHLLSAFIQLLRHNPRRYGGYLIHLGVVSMFIGFAGEAYKEEADVVLRKGQRIRVGPYELRYDGLQMEQDEQKQTITATLSVARHGLRLGPIQPARCVYFKNQDQPTTEVDILRSAKEDLFVVLGNFDAQNHTASFHVRINPLVNWIWIGFLLLTLGAAVALLPLLLPRHKGGVTAGMERTRCVD